MTVQEWRALTDTQAKIIYDESKQEWDDCANCGENGCEYCHYIGQVPSDVDQSGVTFLSNDNDWVRKRGVII